jgi:hypothetical protein
VFQADKTGARRIPNLAEPPLLWSQKCTPCYQ